MPEIKLLIFTVIGLALVFDFINGFHALLLELVGQVGKHTARNLEVQYIGVYIEISLEIEFVHDQ